MVGELSVHGLNECSQHERLLTRFDALRLGECFDLVDRADPQHLFVQLASARGGQFDWRYLEQQPGRWRVRITRLSEKPARSFQQTCPCRWTGRS
jgi:uncharacterized protein (DUF2249 family)